MEALNEFWPGLADYRPALLALAILCLAVLAQSFLAGVLALAKGEEVPGMPLKGDHAKRSFRILRTYANSAENLPAFATVVLLAAFAGASAMLVNWLAALHLAARLAYWGVYYGGIGRPSGGPRTVVYVIGLLANVVLAAAAILALAG